MERLIALGRASGSAGSVASLVVANLLPLVGVLAWGWDLWSLLALYWVENGIIGAINVAKILLAEGVDPAVGLPSPRGRMAIPRTTAEIARAAGALSRVATAAFFTVHYGMFWLVHGIFVLAVLPTIGAATEPGAPGTSGGLGNPVPVPVPGIGDRLELVALGAVVMLISHVLAFWLDYLGRGEYRRATPRTQMAAPYGRLVVLHLTIILGAIATSFLGTPIAALVILVLLKLALDLRLSAGGGAGPWSAARQPAAPDTGTPGT